MKMKRLMDLSLSLLAVIVLSPFFLVLTVLLLVTQGRPVFFKQPRLGYRGRIFNLYKLRTMNPLKDGEDAHSMNRLTPLGKIVRSLSLDELPSLINIIKGEMSIVGPRPLLVEYRDRYTDEEMKRHDVLPGLTGWAQVNGRNTLSWAEKFKYDVWYANNHGFWLDLKIIFLTIKTIIIREGINASGAEIMEEFNPGLYVFGAGGHAKVVISALNANGLKVMGIFDDNTELHGKKVMGVPVLGTFNDSRKFNVKKAIIGIGLNSIRQKVSNDYNYNWITVIHPNAVIDPTVTIGKGTAIFPGAVINADAVIGDHVIVNTGTVIEHDCKVGHFSHICPGSVLAGAVQIGESTLIGTGTKVVPGIKIGNLCTLGAGAVVTKNIPDFSTAVGVPAEVIKNNLSHIQRKKA